MSGAARGVRPGEAIEAAIAAGKRLLTLVHRRGRYIVLDAARGVVVCYWMGNEARPRSWYSASMAQDYIDRIESGEAGSGPGCPWVELNHIAEEF